jgi:hydroxysqualene synthase
MIHAAALRSGKSHRDENFPVASRLIRERHRGAILAFYDFVRTADDIADRPGLPAADKLALLDRLEAALLGQSDSEPEGVKLRIALREHDLTPRHAQDLLTAFRRDVIKRRYRNWNELMDYCRYSAMPVGRFVLDVHGESRETWPVSDAICAALQVINHMQDCGADYRKLDRVYIPLDELAAAGAQVEALAGTEASPQLRACLARLAARTEALLHDGAALPAMVTDTRLALEIAVITQLARRLVHVVQTRDPLSERVHLRAGEVAGVSLLGIIGGASQRLARQWEAARSAAAKNGNGHAVDGEDQTAAQIASGSSFNTAMRILPRDQRQAMLEIYAFCRAVDDIADSQGDPRERLAALERWRRDIGALFAGEVPERLRALATAVRQYDLQQRDFLALIDGMEMDVRVTMRAPDMATLDLYCDRVASAVGRLSVRVFGLGEGDGEALAHHLGRALQLTNILRDLDEDAAIGRLYLPREALQRAGIHVSEPRAVLDHPAIGAACAVVAERAGEHFREADAIMSRLPRRLVRAPRIMAGVYQSLLESLLERGWAAPRQEIRVRRRRMARILLQHAVL